MANEAKTSSTTKKDTPLTKEREAQIMAKAMLKEAVKDAETVGIIQVIYDELSNATIIIFKGVL